MSVVDFPQRETGYWVCACGCMSMFVRDDERFECVNCGIIPETGEAGYCLVFPNGPRHDEVPDGRNPPFSVVNDDPEFMHKRFAGRAERGDFDILIGISSAGRVNAVSRSTDVETHDQRKWLLRRLRDAYRSITRAPARKDGGA